MQRLSPDELRAFLDTGAVPEWAVQQSRERAARQAVCQHVGWNFAQHGRCCWDCGTFLFDPGD